MPASEELGDSSDYYSIINTDDDYDSGEGGGYNSGRGDRVLNGSDDNDDDGNRAVVVEGAGGEEQAGGNGDAGEAGDNGDDEVIAISSRTHGVPAGAMSQLELLGSLAGARLQQSVEVEVVSLARYTFADPELAAAGPVPLEPPLGQTLVGVDAIQPRGARPVGQLGDQTHAGAMARYGDGHHNDRDGVIAEFTEERNNRRLGRIARQLLLPDSYVEACYDLHEFMATEGSSLATESVQRNTFKCLKICARLSKLHGYSIQHMWQVIQQAHLRVSEFTPPRAHTIELWNIKLSNRIRMMAVSPAADGSAPPRLPTVPPPELLSAHARDKLLPLPDIKVAALNDTKFNRAAGASGASYYLTNPIIQQTARVLPPISEMAPMDTGDNNDTLRQLARRSSMALARPLGFHSAGAGRDSGPAVEEHDFLGLMTQEPAAGDDESASTREVELAIIEHQLEELEQMPAHRMGPMLRAALNLLVEMRFRLRLGLPRSSLADDNPLTAPRRIPLGSSAAAGGGGSAAAGNGGGFGDSAVNEDQVIEYVLNRISTSRRTQAQMMDRPGAAMAAGGYGMPLSMLPNRPGMVFAGAGGPGQGLAAQRMGSLRFMPYREAGPRSELRRRRDGDSSGDDSSDSQHDGADRLPVDTDGDVQVSVADQSDDSDTPMAAIRQGHPTTRSRNRRRTTEARRRHQQRRPRLDEDEEDDDDDEDEEDAD
ncbi:hypothetical protein LPJ61_001494 [Coemansia biformis]|uniref:Uncharacterized protein n=1 Tax=Coemansia biformis TaxID=1286918 RepID=A0A9W7YF34_9FUNG|nr:hypothetical protein LPJ61_001494 [Coemansia biformis]